MNAGIITFPTARLLILSALAVGGLWIGAGPAAAPLPPAGLPLDPGRERLAEMVQDSLRKRLMGRRDSLVKIERVVREVAPLVAEAARQPEAASAIGALARDEGITLAAARERWVRLQEADLLLESGGDPDAVSVSEAVGVAQWLAATARGNGLPVNVAASRRLTARIDALKLQIAWREYLLRPDADPRAPGAPPLRRAEAASQLPALRLERDRLRAERRRVDARYDPRRAIFAQTRYLARMYRRFPSLDWVYQAYHGGEAGAARTLRLYLGSRWPGSAAAAIRGRGRPPLRFEDVYFTVTPRARPAAFDYLYGRSDDHRRYWWKLRVAAEAIALYRRDPARLRRTWEAYLPGRALEAAWYPAGPAEALPDLAALRSARRRGALIGVGAGPTLAPAKASEHAALRPASKGLLLLIAAVFRGAGGSETLLVGDMTLTQADVDRAKRLAPPPRKGPLAPPDPDARTLPGGGPPPDFDYHVTGRAFDIARPAAARQRKILDYALGYLEDRRICWRTEAEERGGGRRWHVVPNPRHDEALARIGRTGQAPVPPRL